MQAFPTCPYCNKRFLLDIVRMQPTPIPAEEIELFKQLTDLKVIFDVGARTDTDYLTLWPDSQHHLFEPHPKFFDELYAKVKDIPNVTANNFGLGDKNERRCYYEPLQSFVGNGNAPNGTTDMVFEIKTLGKYVTEKEITHIDYLKIDTEGHDLYVLIGAYNWRDTIRFIQYEHWGEVNNKMIHGLLQDEFEMYDVGYRNVFCMNKKLVSDEERTRLRTYIEEHKLSELV